LSEDRPSTGAAHDLGDGTLGRTLVRSVGWVAIDKWGTRITSLAVLLVLGRLLVPQDFGLVALASSFVALVTIFVDQGFSKALVQRRELAPQHIDTAFWTSLGLALALTLVTLLLAGWLEALMHAPGLARALRWLSLGILLHAASSIPGALLERDFRFRALALRRLSSTLVGGAVAVALALAGMGVWSLVAQTLVSGVVSLVALWAATRFRPRLCLQRAALRELWPVGMGVFGIELAGFVNGQADRLIVGALLSPAELGAYFMAMRIISILVELFTSVLSSMSLSVFSRLQDDPGRLLDWLYRLTAASSTLTLPCFTITAILAPTLIPALLGPHWAVSVPAFQILSLLGAINAVASFDRSVLLAAGRARWAFLLTLGQSVLGVVLVLLATPFGVLGVAAAVVARQYLFWPVRLWVLQLAIGLEPLRYLSQWFRPFAASLLILVLHQALLQAWPALRSVPLAYVLALGSSGLALYVLALRLLHPLAFSDMRTAMALLRRQV
jgi:O-antigen/teichoic acid export membrane protein